MTPHKYVTSTGLDHVVTDIRDYIQICYKVHDKNLKEETKKIHLELQESKGRFQAYEKWSTQMILELQKTTKEIKSEIKEIKKDTQEFLEFKEELRDMNKYLLGLISYQEKRMRDLEKKL